MLWDVTFACCLLILHGVYCDSIWWVSSFSISVDFKHFFADWSIWQLLYAGFPIFLSFFIYLVYMHVHLCTFVCSHVYGFACIHYKFLYPCIYIYMCIAVYKCIYEYIHTYTCIYIFICVYATKLSLQFVDTQTCRRSWTVLIECQQTISLHPRDSFYM